MKLDDIQARLLRVKNSERDMRMKFEHQFKVNGEIDFGRGYKEGAYHFWKQGYLTASKENGQ